MSPYGYSGSKGSTGRPATTTGRRPGRAASTRLYPAHGAKDRSTENPSSPRNVLRQFYVKPPFMHKREEELLSSMLSLRVGEDWYPGDMLASSHWPGVAPGKRGLVNAFSRHNFNAGAIVDIEPSRRSCGFAAPTT